MGTFWRQIFEEGIDHYPVGESENDHLTCPTKRQWILSGIGSKTLFRKKWTWLKHLYSFSIEIRFIQSRGSTQENECSHYQSIQLDHQEYHDQARKDWQNSNFRHSTQKLVAWSLCSPGFCWNYCWFCLVFCWFGKTSLTVRLLLIWIDTKCILKRSINYSSLTACDRWSPICCKSNDSALVVGIKFNIRTFNSLDICKRYKQAFSDKNELLLI